MTRLSKVTLYLIYLAMVAILVLSIIMAFRSNTSQISPKTNTPQSHVAQKQNKAQPSNSSSSSSASSTQSPPKSAAQLNNTGPGNTLGLFAVASASGAVIYRYRLIRRR